MQIELDFTDRFELQVALHHDDGIKLSSKDVSDQSNPALPLMVYVMKDTRSIVDVGFHLTILEHQASASLLTSCNWKR